MGFLLTMLVGTVTFIALARAAKTWGEALDRLRAGADQVEHDAACCCEREAKRKQHDEAVAAGLRRRKAWRESREQT